MKVNEPVHLVTPAANPMVALSAVRHAGLDTVGSEVAPGITIYTKHIADAGKAAVGFLHTWPSGLQTA
jgi:hypothetical protein